MDGSPEGFIPGFTQVIRRRKRSTSNSTDAPALAAQSEASTPVSTPVALQQGVQGPGQVIELKPFSSVPNSRRLGSRKNMHGHARSLTTIPDVDDPENTYEISATSMPLHTAHRSLNALQDAETQSLNTTSSKHHNDDILCISQPQFSQEPVPNTQNITARSSSAMSVRRSTTMPIQHSMPETDTTLEYTRSSAPKLYTFSAHQTLCETQTQNVSSFSSDYCATHLNNLQECTSTPEITANLMMTSFASEGAPLRFPHETLNEAVSQQPRGSSQSASSCSNLPQLNRDIDNNQPLLSHKSHNVSLGLGLALIPEPAGLTSTSDGGALSQQQATQQHNSNVFGISNISCGNKQSSMQQQTSDPIRLQQHATPTKEQPQNNHLNLNNLAAPSISFTQPGSAAAAAAATQPDSERQGFWDYLQGEARPPAKIPTADVVWGQTERDRVYNFLMYVPYQLERLIQFGTLLCWDSLIAVVTVMPLRAVAALIQLTHIRQLFSWMLPCNRSTAGSKGHAVSSQGDAASQPPAAEQSNPSKSRIGLAGNQVYDILCLLIIVTCTAILRFIKPGFIYYWLKDITSEFLKMSVLSSAFEITDKILSNFGMDVMEALSGTCTLWVAGRRSTAQLAADTVIALGITITHAVTLMCQGLVLAVALNSRRQGLLALLIANNFVEIKGAVFKRWDVPRIWGLVCQDIVERLHLWGVLMFVVVEEMDSAASWSPSSMIMWECIRILGAEIVIDVLKHAVLGKFNDTRPGIYREYMKDLCEKAAASQSYVLNKLMGFQTLPTACLMLRAVTTLFWLRMDVPNAITVWQRAAVVSGMWLLLLCFKPLLGYTLKIHAFAYVNYYNATYPAKAGNRPIGRAAALPSLTPLALNPTAQNLQNLGPTTALPAAQNTGSVPSWAVGNLSTPRGNNALHSQQPPTTPRSLQAAMNTAAADASVAGHRTDSKPHLVAAQSKEENGVRYTPQKAVTNHKTAMHSADAAAAAVHNVVDRQNGKPTVEVKGTRKGPGSGKKSKALSAGKPKR